MPGKLTRDPSDSSASEDEKSSRRRKWGKRSRKAKKSAVRNTLGVGSVRTVSDGSDDSSSLHSDGSTSEEGDQKEKASKGLNLTRIHPTNTLFRRALDYRT